MFNFSDRSQFSKYESNGNPTNYDPSNHLSKFALTYCLKDADVISKKKSVEEVLAEVKAHSHNISSGRENAPLHLEWTDGDWQTAFELLFMASSVHATYASRQDDLLFFVRKVFASSSSELTSPFFVRRWMGSLNQILAPSEVGVSTTSSSRATGRDESAGSIHWRLSLHLNLVLHTDYHLTVAICSRSAILSKSTGLGSTSQPFHKVSTRVFASPTKISMDSKEESAKASYPVIFFGMEDQDAFRSMILSNADHCLCVLLWARGGLAFPTPGPPPSPDVSNHPDKKPRILLFSGFVALDQLTTAHESAHRRYAGFLPGKQGEAARVIMRGPGGSGEAEVAVTDTGTESDASSKSLFSHGYKKAASVASAMGGYALGRPSSQVDTVPLQCSVLSISLPCAVLTHDLLFKPWA